MDIKKRHIYAIIGLLILVIGIFTIYAVVDTDKAWHSPNEVLITVDGYTMTLGEATTDNVFVVGANSSGTTEVPSSGHNFNEIWISVDGDEKTLQDALSTTGLCGNSTISYSSAPSTLAYHFANEIEISSGTSLQDAIDNGEFCPPCEGEGESIPVIENPPECCAGLTLILPQCDPSEVIWPDECPIGTIGICTANCGNGVCDPAIESAYNCPVDCIEYYWKFTGIYGRGNCGSVVTIVCDSSKIGDIIAFVGGPQEDLGDTVTAAFCAIGQNSPPVTIYECSVR